MGNDVETTEAPVVDETPIEETPAAPETTDTPPQGNTDSDESAEKQESDGQQEEREDVGGFADAVKEDEPEKDAAEGDEESAEDKEEGEKSSPVVFDLENVELPENMEVAPEIAEEMGKIATENGFDGEQSEALLKVGAEYQSRVAAKQTKVTEDFIFDLRKQCRSDPDIIGENGTDYKQSMLTCKKAILSAGESGKALFEKMKTSPVIFVDDPDLVKVLKHHGRLSSEDISPQGDNAKPHNALNKYDGLM